MVRVRLRVINRVSKLLPPTKRRGHSSQLPKAVYVCMSVCDTITFENLDVISSFWTCWYILRRYRSSSYVKVIGSRSHEQKRAKISILVM